MTKAKRMQILAEENQSKVYEVMLKTIENLASNGRFEGVFDLDMDLHKALVEDGFSVDDFTTPGAYSVSWFDVM